MLVAPIAYEAKLIPSNTLLLVDDDILLFEDGYKTYSVAFSCKLKILVNIDGDYL